MEEDIFTYCLLFLFTICTVVSVCCLLLLCHTKSRIINQKYMIANLMLVEFTFAFIRAFLICSRLFQIHLTLHNTLIILYIRIVVAFVYIFTMHHICLDRLFEIYFHLNYPVRITKKRTICIIVSIWLIALLFGVILILLIVYIYNTEIISVFAFYFYFATDVTFLIHAISTYTYLYIKFRQLNKLRKQQSRRFHQSFKSPKFLLPCLIILS